MYLTISSAASAQPTICHHNHWPLTCLSLHKATFIQYMSTDVSITFDHRTYKNIASVQNCPGTILNSLFGLSVFLSFCHCQDGPCGANKPMLGIAKTTPIHPRQMRDCGYIEHRVLGTAKGNVFWISNGSRIIRFSLLCSCKKINEQLLHNFTCAASFRHPPFKLWPTIQLLS